MESFGLQDWTRIGAMNLKIRKLLICSASVLRFMESLHFFFETHWDHEPGRVAFVRAPRSVTAQYFDVPVYGLLVGKIGSG
jgi:hypothetical protein